MPTSVGSGLTLDACSESCHDNRIEVGPGAALQLGESLVDATRLAVRPVSGHGAEGITSADDACDERDLLGDQPVRIARAVPVLVTRTNDSADVAEDPTDLRQKPFAFHCVRLHDPPLFLGQLARLVDDLCRDLDL